MEETNKTMAISHEEYKLLYTVFSRAMGIDGAELILQSGSVQAACKAVMAYYERAGLSPMGLPKL